MSQLGYCHNSVSTRKERQQISETIRSQLSTYQPPAVVPQAVAIVIAVTTNTTTRPFHVSHEQWRHTSMPEAASVTTTTTTATHKYNLQQSACQVPPLSLSLSLSLSSSLSLLTPPDPFMYLTSNGDTLQCLKQHLLQLQQQLQLQLQLQLQQVNQLTPTLSQPLYVSKIHLLAVGYRCQHSLLIQLTHCLTHTPSL